MDKIKAVNPNIIVRGNVDKPYYLIEYYDLSDNEWHIGYGSYCLANVKEWLKTCFEVTNVDVAPVKHGHWVYNQNGHDWGLGAWECSLCHSVVPLFLFNCIVHSTIFLMKSRCCDILNLHNPLVY